MVHETKCRQALFDSNLAVPKFSMSPKPNLLFIVSQCHLFKIRQLVHEILCNQETVMLMGSTPKTICPLRGHNKHKQYFYLSWASSAVNLYF